LKFLVKTQVDDDGKVILDPGEETRFVEARAGDHLMTPFQCDTCHFRNFMGRSPVMTNLLDKEIFGFIRQANLDSFWCRAKSTVAANMREGVHMEKTVDRLGMPPVTPPMGPYPSTDSVGMKMAIAVLDRSLDPGLYSECVQWDTFRRIRSAGVTNISQAGVLGL
jgi:hypothetical protein